jgi:hypothetical protein
MIRLYFLVREGTAYPWIRKVPSLGVLRRRAEAARELLSQRVFNGEEIDGQRSNDQR